MAPDEPMANEPVETTEAPATEVAAETGVTAVPDPVGEAAAAQAAERKEFLLPVVGGLRLGRDATGNVVVEYVSPDAGIVLARHTMLPDEFAAVIQQLGDLGPATKTPGADETIRPVAAE